MARHTDQLEEATGFKLVKDTAPTGGVPFLNKAHHSTTSTSTSTSTSSSILTAFTKDVGPLADAVKDLLNNPSKEAAEDLLKRLPSLLPDDPAMAAVLAEAMAKEFDVGSASSAAPDEHLANRANECRAGNPAHCRVHGTPEAQKEKPHTAATTDQVKKFLANPPDKISKEDFDALLTTGFTDKDGAGNDVKYGKLLRDHWPQQGHNKDDIEARMSKLGVAVKMIRSTKPIPSGNPDKPNERVYFGYVDKKAYIAIADEHNEIDALEMVSYRRDKREDKR